MLALQLPTVPLTAYGGEGGFRDRRQARRRLLPIFFQEKPQPSLPNSAGVKRARPLEAISVHAEVSHVKKPRLQEVGEVAEGRTPEPSAEADLLSALTTLTEAADLLEAEEAEGHGEAGPSASMPPPSPRSPRAMQVWTPSSRFSPSLSNRHPTQPVRTQLNPIVSLLPTARRKQDGSPTLEPWDPTSGVLQRDECADYLRCVSPWVAGGKAVPELRAKAALNCFLQSHIGEQKMKIWTELSKEVGPAVQARRRMGAAFLRQRTCSPHRSRMARRALAATAAAQKK